MTLDEEMVGSRYDGHAEFYDQAHTAYGELERPGSSSAQLARLLGPGDGWCLDVACGTGLHFRAVRATGRRIVGVELSWDQLAIARRRVEGMDAVVRGDASRLPFVTATFSAAVCTFLHTDIDDMEPVFAEVFRVLRPGARFVYLGVHPCFRGHFLDMSSPDARVVHPGYWDTGWVPPRAGPVSEMRRRLGGQRHVTLSELLGALLDSRLRLRAFEEADRAEAFAERIALVATKDG